MSAELERLADLAAEEPAAAWAGVQALGPAADAEAATRRAAFALAVAGLRLGRWSEVDAFAGRLLGQPGTADPAAARSCWRLRSVALLLCGDQGAAEAAERRGVADPDDACRLATCAASALAAAGRTAEAAARLALAAGHAAALPTGTPAVAQLADAARGILARAGELHRSSHRLALAAGEALAAASAGLGWRRRHRALAERAHALLDLGETLQPGMDLEELVAIEDGHGAGAAERCWSATVHCRLTLALRGPAAALPAWEACRDFAARMGDRDPALGTVLDALAADLGPA